MSLVAYDASSDEEDDDMAPTITPAVTRASDTSHKSVRVVVQPVASSSGMRTMKSATGKMQILAPSFENLDSSDEDEDQPKLKNLKPSDRGSGLRSLLPPVRGSSSSTLFVPKSAQRPASQIALSSPSSSSITSLIPQSVKRKPVETVIPPKKRKEEDIEIDPTNFFSLADEDMTDRTEQMESEERIRHLPAVNLTPVVADDPPVAHEIHSQPVPQQQNAGMSEQQLKKMISNQFGGEDPADKIELVDVNVNDHLCQSKEYLKSITTEKDMADRDAPQPNSTVRRKHHITYLAHQAKQRELALKEEWARNKATRNQSRAKYGF